MGKNIGVMVEGFLFFAHLQEDIRGGPVPPIALRSDPHCLLQSFSRLPCLPPALEGSSQAEPVFLVQRISLNRLTQEIDRSIQINAADIPLIKQSQAVKRIRVEGAVADCFQEILRDRIYSQRVAILPNRDDLQAYKNQNREEDQRS